MTAMANDPAVSLAPLAKLVDRVRAFRPLPATASVVLEVKIVFLIMRAISGSGLQRLFVTWLVREKDHSINMLA
jgi:hypothetical protein